MSKNIQYLYLGFFNWLCVIMFLAFNIDIIFGITLLIWLDLFLYSVSKFNERSVLFGFLITFFVFLMGRQTLEVFGMHKIEIEFSADILKKTEIALLLSLLGLFVGYIFGGKYRFFKIKSKIERKSNLKKQNLIVQYVRKISCVFFHITYPFLILKTLESAIYVSHAGYLSSYISFSSNLPYIVQKLAEISPIFLFAYLGTLPSKKECQMNIFIYIIYLLMTLATGRRYECIGGLLLIVVYYVLRTQNNTNVAEKWIGRKEKIIILAGAIGIVFVANIIGTVRYGGETYKSSNGYLSDFVYQQGISINVIKRYIEYGDSLPKGKLYFIGSTLSVLARSPIGRFLKIAVYGGNTVENALNGFSFAHALSYTVMGNQYLNGNGMGSSYIAEIMYSFGYIGVFIANVFYGVLLKKMFKLEKNKLWSNIIIIIMLSSLFFAPRGSFDAFFADLLSVNVWGTLLFVWFISNVIYKNKSSRVRGK